MINKFKEYGFKRKMLNELNCTGVKGEALKGEKYGYTKTFNDNKEIITFSIIPQNGEWVCEKEVFNKDIFDEIADHEIMNYENFINSGESRFNYSMKELNYTVNSYKKVSRWAYMKSKEEALEEILTQYSYLFGL